MNPTAASISRAGLSPLSWCRCHLTAHLAVGGYLAGFSVLPNEWFHLGILALGGVMVIGKEGEGLRTAEGRGDAAPWLVGAFLMWMTVRSLWAGELFEGAVLEETVRGLVGLGLLGWFCVLTWGAARDAQFMKMEAWMMGLPAGFAAVVSMLSTYVFLEEGEVGGRLTNPLVHGGLNPVCTGLIFGFAAVWLTVRAGEEAGRRRRWVWGLVIVLHLAAFLSGSRGTMLAMVCGHAALLVGSGWRRSWRGAAVLVVTGLVYFTAMPVWDWMTGPVPGSAVTMMGPPAPHPLQQALERGDSGRLEIYRAGWKIVENPWWGTGQWGVREQWQGELRRGSLQVMIHLHSGFFATWVHGGVIGLGLLLGVLGLAWRRACRVAGAGDATWVALLAFGCGGLLFDGQSLTSLVTAPRFEGLLFWLPVMVALVRGRVGTVGGLR